MSFKKWNRRRWWYKFYAYWYCKKKEGVFYMAHTCPVCWMTCHCNGDIDDIYLNIEEVFWLVRIALTMKMILKKSFGRMNKYGSCEIYP